MIPDNYPRKKGDRQNWTITRRFSTFILENWKARVIKQEKQFNNQIHFNH